MPNTSSPTQQQQQQPNTDTTPTDLTTHHQTNPVHLHPAAPKTKTELRLIITQLNPLRLQLKALPTPSLASAPPPAPGAENDDATAEQTMQEAVWEQLLEPALTQMRKERWERLDGVGRIMSSLRAMGDRIEEELEEREPPTWMEREESVAKRKRRVKQIEALYKLEALYEVPVLGGWAGGRSKL